MNNFHMREGKVEFRWKRWRNKKRQEVSSCLMVLFSGMVLLGAGGVALAGPTGGQVTGGTGTITQNGGTTNIDQTSNVLNINWTDFSIGQTETVNFNQPDSNSLAINRVIGGVPSQLAGALNANGRVFILNSAGITFTGTSHVNVGALLATTAMTVNGDPTKAASYSGGTGYGAVINQGSIQVSNGGFAILAAPYVQNTGFIKADLGTIALAGTNQFTLDLSGTGLINFVVPAGTVEQIVSDGKALGVDNSGTLQARSGQLIISANVATQVINAAVNLNGVIDADAFAPNGAGGSVLVTGAGDINIGGQVTARGDGAGAGGQIITKAAGADAIEALAFVSAAGGTAGGKGGLIEVSGKQGVGLAGNIDPGKGGSVLIDPNNITIISGTAGSLIGTHIGSDFIENQLRHGINVTLDASGGGGGGNVTFQTLADDHKMVGGSGNLSILADNNIIVQGTNDAIVQGSGFIHLTANHGNIGSAGHALSLVTGVGTTSAGQGVSQAGDIVLKAAGDINVKNVTIKSSGDSHLTALFSASAGHAFTATGDINVQAIARGSAQQTASATVNVFAHNDITLRNVTVVARASQNSASNTGADAHAVANLNLFATSGGIFTRNLAVNAQALDAARSADAQANASAEINALGAPGEHGSVQVNGGIDVTANANQVSSHDGSAFACANLAIKASSGSDSVGQINVNGHVTVEADARTHGSGPASANAHGEIGGGTSNDSNNQAVDVRVGGNIEVSASADANGGNALACASLDVDAISGALDIEGNVLVKANAVTQGFGTASANANAELAAESGDEFSSSQLNSHAGDVTVNGDINVTADAVQNGGEGGFARACAALDVDASFSFGDINITGNVGADAKATTEASGSPEAQANAFVGLDAEGSVTVDGNVHVGALASQDNSEGEAARACAALQMNASFGNVVANHDINVDATALAQGHSDAIANAEINIFASENIAIGGDVNAQASADQNGVDGSLALACANVNLHIGLGGSVNVDGGVLASANAFSKGSESAVANAAVHINVFGDITVNGVVTANAHATASSTGAGENGALALASIDVNGDPVVLGGIDEHATATSHNDGTPANAVANASVHGLVDLLIHGDVTVVAKALDTSSTNGKGAVANAHLLANAGNLLSISGDMNMLASANDFGHAANANALASGSLTGRTQVLVDGDITVTADGEVHGNSAHAATGVLAKAKLTVGVASGNGTLGAVAVNAFASGNGIASTHGVTASALFSAQAQNLVVERATRLTANAVGTDDLFVNPFKAEAQMSVHAAHRASFDGGISASADANGTGGPGVVQALTRVTITAEDAIDIDSHFIVGAHAHGENAGPILATANASLNGVANAPDIDVSGTTNVHATASGTDQAHSTGINAVARLIANGHAVTFDNIIVDASANGSANAGLIASANANLLAANAMSIGGVDVEANGFDSHSGIVNVQAIANAQGSNVTVGNATVRSMASGSNAIAISNATLKLTDSAFIHVTGNINVEADMVASGFGPIGANALASLNGNTITVDGNTRVVAKTTGSNASASVFANAEMIMNASHNEHFGNGIDVEALVNGVDAPIFNGHALAQFNATSLQIDNTLKVLENVHGNSATSVLANPTINMNVPLVLLNGVDVEAIALGNGVGLVSADASFVYTNVNYHDRGQTRVFASASGTHIGKAQADATLQITAASNATFGGGIDVVASVNGSGATFLANAIANTFAGNILTFGNDVTVAANASATSATKIMGQALANLTGNNGINLSSGDVSVTANAIAGANDSFGTVAAVASLHALAPSGGIHLGGNVDVAVNVVYEPADTHFSGSNGFVTGNVFALANAEIVASGGGITVDGDIDVQAQLRSKGENLGNFLAPSFGAGTTYFEQTAAALLNIDAHQGAIKLHGVTAKATANWDGSGTMFGLSSLIVAGAITLVNITAHTGSVSIDGPLDVEAKETAPNEAIHTVSKVTAVGALAAVNVEASNQIHTKDVTVNAFASASSAFPFIPSLFITDAIALANFTAGSTVKIDGNAEVSAEYNGINTFATLAVAGLHINAHNEFASINGNMDVTATINIHSASESGGHANIIEAIACASIEAGTGASIAGHAVVKSNVEAFFASESAVALTNFDIEAPHIRIGGSVDAEALASALLGRNVFARTDVNLNGPDGIEIDGDVTVTASARTFFLASNVVAEAFFNAEADSGSVTVGGDLSVLASAVDAGFEIGNDGFAFAKAGANIFGNSGVTVGGTVDVEAHLFDRGGDATQRSGKFGLFGAFSGTGGLASAQVDIVDIHNGGVSLGGLTVKASADVENPGFGFSTAGALANAVANAHVVSSDGSIVITGNVIGEANAFDSGFGGANAVALIDLEPGASLGGASSVNLHIGGFVSMNAQAEAGTHSEGNVVAIAVLNADADGGKVLIDGSVDIRANALDLASEVLHSVAHAAAYANADLEGDSGVSVGGGVTATALLNTRASGGFATPVSVDIGDESFSFDFGHAEAFVDIHASSGSVHVGKLVRASASAIGDGSRGGSPHGIAATASVDVEASGNINLGGAVANAFATQLDQGAAFADAFITLAATSGSVNIGPNGMFDMALANATDGSFATANAQTSVNAWHSVFIQGDVIAIAGAVSDGTGNIGHANIHLAGGSATEFGPGTGSFGNVVVIGDIAAIAFADASNDQAIASVEIFAHNNILLIGNDPIASARVGPSGGTTFAFRQAHFTTHDGTNFGPGGGALADIDIRAGEQVVVIPLSSLTNIDKLFALPTDTPILPVGDLTIIPLTVQDGDCGVLGIAGADPAAIEKAKACHKSPINVSDLTGETP